MKERRALSNLIKFIPQIETDGDQKFMLVLNRSDKRYWKLPAGRVRENERGNPESTITRKLKKYGYTGPFHDLKFVSNYEIWKVDDNASIPVVIENADVYSLRIPWSDLKEHLSPGSHIGIFGFYEAAYRIKLSDEADHFRDFYRTIHNIPSYISNNKIIDYLKRTGYYGKKIAGGFGYIEEKISFSTKKNEAVPRSDARDSRFQDK
jgi:hypothetical protein